MHAENSPDAEPAPSTTRLTSHQSQQRPDQPEHRRIRPQPAITPGTGKTHLAIALAIKAAEATYPVMFDSATMVGARDQDNPASPARREQHHRTRKPI